MKILKDGYEYARMEEMVIKYLNQIEQELKIRLIPPMPYRNSLYYLQTQLRLIEKNPSITITKCVGKWHPINQEIKRFGTGVGAVQNVVGLVTLDKEILGTRFWLRDGLIIDGVMQKSSVDLVLGDHLERICELRMMKAPLLLGEPFFAGEFHINTNTNAQP